jgi:hypothetical protein
LLHADDDFNRMPKVPIIPLVIGCQRASELPIILEPSAYQSLPQLKPPTVRDTMLDLLSGQPDRSPA